jgi:prepilin-type N-terminal cleavage/methylation domain-containing protein
MTHHKRRGFTLIELLVVIAIIAILAAILFPVFAQAKRAAKGSVAISDAKQMALGQIMYAGDADDYFSPVVVFPSTVNAGAMYPWSFLQQPYMKSWGVLLDPTGPAIKLDNANDNSGGYSAFALYGMWGMPPERIASIGATSPDNFTFGQQTAGSKMTGGQLYYYDGIAGAGIEAHTDWASYDYKVGGTSSLSATAISSPADQLMIAQSGTWDFMWENNGNGYGDFGNGNDTPDNFDLYYSGCGSNAYGCASTSCGPLARQRDSDGAAAGFLPWPSGNVDAQPLPTGLVAWAGTDGHVKATPWKQLMGTTIPINGGSAKAIKAFWPQGQ